MKKFNSGATIQAKDMFISFASKLPSNLLLDAVSDYGLFTTSFILRLKEEELCDLRKEARKHENKPVFMFFFSVPEKELGKQLPHEVKDYATFDFSKVVSLSFNGSTTPFLPYRNADPIHYISVTFVLKD